MLFQLRPNEFSKAWQACIGNHICGIEESINVKMPWSSKLLFVVVASLNSIACKPTTRSRDISPAIVKSTSLGMNFEASNPPNVRVPVGLFGPGKD